MGTIAIVGRPNVGKSSLFNAVIGRRLSIVHEMSGVTRDRVVAMTGWNGRHFQLVDTGGLGLDRSDRWDEAIAAQVFAAVAEADVLVMVVNVQQGIVELDREVARKLRALNRPILLAVNKCDNPEFSAASSEFAELGFPKIVPISCLHRLGISDLLDGAVALLPKEELPEPEAVEEDGSAKRRNGALRIAVIGRPNVGKSSLVNALLGADRVIVSDEAGTTRDAVEVDFTISYRGEARPAALIDTAGLRKTAKVHDAVEMFSVMRAKTAIEQADLVLFVVENGTAGEAVTAQDRRIAGMVQQAEKACIIVANKFDCCDDEISVRQLKKSLRTALPMLDYAPVAAVSALKRLHLNTLFDLIAQVAEQLELKLSTGLVNRVLADAFEKVSPPVVGASALRLYYASMVAQAPPKFLLFVNQPKYCAPNYLAYLKNALREAFDLTGLPLRIELRARPKKVEAFHTPSRSVPGRKK